MGKHIPPAPGELCLRMERVASSLSERVRLEEQSPGDLAGAGAGTGHRRNDSGEWVKKKLLYRIGRVINAAFFLTMR